MTRTRKGTMIFNDGSTFDFRAAYDGDALHIQPEKIPQLFTLAAEKYFAIIDRGAAALRQNERRMIEAVLFSAGDFEPRPARDF